MESQQSTAHKTSTQRARPQVRAREVILPTISLPPLFILVLILREDKTFSNGCVSLRFFISDLF